MVPGHLWDRRTQSLIPGGQFGMHGDRESIDYTPGSLSGGAVNLPCRK